MFSGNEVQKIKSTLSEEEFHAKVEEAFRSLGRVTVDKRGGISIEPKESMKSFLSELTIDGSIRAKEGAYEVDVNYDLSPSTANWIIAVVLFCTTFFGALIVLFPLIEKGKVSQTIDRALRDLEHSTES